MKINRNNVFEIINDCNCRPDKDYGQNFLVEESICEEIVKRLEISSSDKILEIGPGIGSITHFICDAANKCDVVDVDERMCDFLAFAYKTFPITIINQDVRKLDISNYTKIIGNLPYNITTELVQYILLNGISADKVVLMCQSETFNHFIDTAGSEYGPTSVLIHLVGTVKKELIVKAGSFIPVPKCNSTVFSIKIKSGLNRDDINNAFLLAKSLFANRRKTIYNNLVSFLGNKDLALKVLENLNISPMLRPEQLKPEEYLKLYKEIQNQ